MTRCVPMCSSQDSDCASSDFCEDKSKLCIPLLPKGLFCPDGDHSCVTGALTLKQGSVRISVNVNTLLLSYRLCP